MKKEKDVLTVKFFVKFLSNPIDRYSAMLYTAFTTPTTCCEYKIYDIETREGLYEKFVCSVCGYVHEGDTPPAQCPVRKAPAEKFKEQAGDLTWAAEHVIGVAKGVSEDIIKDLRANFEGECTEVGMYLAMARVAHREAISEVGLYYEKAAYEEAEHAAKFAELLGEVVTDSTKKNLELRVAAEKRRNGG